MDHDGDGIVSGLEMAVGILSSAEPWPLASAAYLRRRSSPFERYPFGEKQCVDPTLDAVSFLECAVHRHRSTGQSEATEPAMGFEELFALHVHACTTPAAAWLEGLCLGTCTQCATPAPREHLPVMAPSPPLGADAVTILISSDSHVEPWYLSPSAPPLNPSDGATTATPKYRQLLTDAGVSRFHNATLENMFSCQNKHSVPSTCELILADPPVDIHASHYYSKAAANATVYFFVGDSQAHSFDGSPSAADNAKAVNLTLTRMMSDVLKRFGGSAANIVWTAGNNDGPHDSIFKQQDNATRAWASALLAANVVTDDLGVEYTSSFSETEVFSQTDVFKLVGFYMKALPALTNRSYAIVLNTNLGGDNPAQQSYLKQSLEWVHRTHGDAGIVYVLGHHPEVMSVGTDVVPEAYRPMVKGVFCGHNHVAMSTSSKLFTNVGGLTFSSVPRPHNFLIAQVDADHPEVRIDVSHAGVNGFHYYTPGDNRKVTDVTMWN